MSDEPDHLILVYLRRIDESVQRLAEDMRDVKQRMSAIEGEAGHLRIGLAGVNGRIDRIEVRLDRIERRLDLVAVS